LIRLESKLFLPHQGLRRHIRT